MSQHNISFFLACALFLIFAAMTQWWPHKPVSSAPPVMNDRIVISAPVLVALYAGDRYLAANLETFRSAATGTDFGAIDTPYLIRSLHVASKLNPCQEDNYYFANAFLTWGGAEQYSDEILRSAIDCRFWDDLPAFFYGIHLYFFKHDIPSAVTTLNLAAARSQVNSASYKKLAIMLEVGAIEDERLALEHLKYEMNQATDPKLKALLEKRVARLQGLVLLRDAQRRYTAQTGKKLQTLVQLITADVIDRIPVDPLRIGYEVKNGHVELRKIKIAGVEN